MINSEIDKYSYLQFSEETETHIVIPQIFPEESVDLFLFYTITVNSLFFETQEIKKVSLSFSSPRY